MRKFSLSKLITIMACLMVAVSGCDKKKAEDFIRNAPSEDQQILKNFHSQKPENILNEGVINMRVGELEKAISLLENFTQLYPTDPIGQFYLGQAYYKNNRFEEAITRLNRAYRLDNTNTTSLLYMGKALARTDKQQEAVNVLLTYILSEPSAQNRLTAIDEINDLAEPVAGKYIIDNVYLTDKPKNNEKIFAEPKICFSSDTREIYAIIKTVNAPAETEIEGNLYYVVSKEEKKKIQTAEYKAESSEIAIMPFKKPLDGFWQGEYELEIFVDKEKNNSIKFYVF